MFRDTSEELARLEAELLSEEEPEELPEEEEEDDPWQYEDTRAAAEPEVFQNYSNDYGRSLRNYATGYRAYNSDDCDEDLDTYSEEVRLGKKSRVGCLGVAICLIAVILTAAVILWLAWERGLL